MVQFIVDFLFDVMTWTAMSTEPRNFIRTQIEQDLSSKKHNLVVTRFPPEPNGYLHIGHAKSICLNFGLVEQFPGYCHLRMDDTNPEKESEEYVQAIQEDIKWLGFNWHGEVRYASDYFETLYDYALMLIRKGLAYVCELNADEMRSYRGTLTESGKNSPYRDRPIDENLSLFMHMRAGDFPDGSKTLRLKIDMSSPNLNLRDPVIYRIRRAHHHRTGDHWCIYPMYDYTHCISDALEGITHSLCTLEFEDHRPLYDWILAQLDTPCHPQQIEFSRLELLSTVTSKRKLNQLVHEGLVSGWDDPRMPTISGMRRRGYPPEGIRLFAARIGISKSENIVDLSVLEGAVREHLESSVPRVLAVLDPIKVVITNYNDHPVSSRVAPYHPQHPEFGERDVPIGSTLWIERDDFSEHPPEGWQRLRLGGEVRLRYSYVMRCDHVEKNADGQVEILYCSIDHATLGKNPEGRKVKGVIHWLACEHAQPITVRLYDRLFLVPRPDAQKKEDGQVLDFTSLINPDALRTVHAWIEKGVSNALPETRYQFERLGYFVADRYDHQPCQAAVFNRIVGLKDSWANAQA
jgi:glutaminyl-tRNA synthetase